MNKNRKRQSKERNVAVSLNDKTTLLLITAKIAKVYQELNNRMGFQFMEEFFTNCQLIKASDSSLIHLKKGSGSKQLFAKNTCHFDESKKSAKKKTTEILHFFAHCFQFLIHGGSILLWPVYIITASLLFIIVIASHNYILHLHS